MDLARFTTCTYPVREMPAPAAFARLAATGLTRLDVWGRPPHFSTDPAECDPATLAHAAAEAGVTIAHLGTYCGEKFDSDNPAEVRAELTKTLRTIELARQFGCGTIRIRPGRSDKPEVVHKVAPHYRQVIDAAAAAGIKLVMENHKGSVAGLPELAVELCQAVDSPFFGVLWEPCNLLHGGVDPQATFDQFRPYILHVHLKDGRVTEQGFERCHLGRGQVDIPWCLKALAQIGYTGDFALEYEIRDLEEIDTGLVQWRQYIEAL